jgi:hypothetical protein
MTEFSISIAIRAATNWDEYVAKEKGIDISEGEFAVLIVDGCRVAYTDEYGTAYVIPGERLSQETAERLAEAAVAAWTEAQAG